MSKIRGVGVFICYAPTFRREKLMRPYKPGKDDLIWAERMLSVISDNGILAFPATQLIYRVSHKSKTLTLLNPEILSDEFSEEVHSRSIAVFSELGYLILVREEGDG